MIESYNIKKDGSAIAAGEGVSIFHGRIVDLQICEQLVNDVTQEYKRKRTEMVYSISILATLATVASCIIYTTL